MKRFFRLILLCLCCCAGAAARETVPLADPFILLHGDTYYAYGTRSMQGIEFFTSKDLKTWKSGGLALHKDDVFGEKWFWAPEVYKVGERFLMFYSGDTHICAAWADSPRGPFKQTEQKPMMKERSIDHTLLIEEDGTPRIFCERFKDGTSYIWNAVLTPDLNTVKVDTFHYCIGPDQPWELKHQRIVEGSAVLKHNGKYYLTYSGNGYPTPYYGIGCAVADRPEGPWVKYEDNPIFQLPGDLKGVGHHAFFKDKEGKLRVVFHAHFSDKAVHPRQMYITTAEFKGDKLTISPDYLIPMLERDKNQPGSPAEKK